MSKMLERILTRASCVTAAIVAAVACAPRSAYAAEADHDDPDTELRSFKVAEGYEVHLFASEKDGIVKPVQMRWDPAGRLWVACIPSYPQRKPTEAPDDRIVVLADTDGAGVANYASVFARGLSLPLGLELGHGGLYVSSGTELLHLKDNNGDGKADETRVVLRGFFTGDSHQNINSFTWGPGGELMFCQGLHAFSHVETPWGNQSLEKAGIWRFRPRTMRLESFLGRDRGPQNPWGIVFDDWGQPIMIAGNGQGIYYLLPSLIQTDHFLDPHQIWDRNGIKLCGVDVIGTRAMPPTIQGMMVAGSIMDNSVYFFKLDETGSGFKVRQYTPLIVSMHSSFRAVDAKVGPDGAIYIADWYNPIIGHYQASLRDPNRDHAHGRIWRITAKGLPLVQRPALASFAIAQLIDQFRSPERWVRYQAKRLLADKDAKAVGEALDTWVHALDPADPQYEHMLVEALGVYEEQEIVEPALLQKLLGARDERARAYATGVIGHWSDRLDDPIALLERQAADPSPRVRLEAVVAAAQVPLPRAIEAAAIVVDLPMDEFLANALTQAVHALKPYWKPALDIGQLSFANKPARMEFVFKADGSADVLHTLASLAGSAKPGDPVHDNSLRLVAAIGGPGELAAVLNDPILHPTDGRSSSAAAGVLDAMAENFRMHRAIPAGDVGAALRPLLAWNDSDVRRSAIVLAGLWRTEALRTELDAIAQDAKAVPLVRLASFGALADLGGNASRTSLIAVASSKESLHVRAAAIEALARLDLPTAASAAAAALTQATTDADVADVLDAMFKRQGGPEALANALTQAKLAPDTAKLALRAMSSAGRQDPVLWDPLARLSGTAIGPRAYDATLVKALATEVASAGNPAAGERVFRSQMANCLSCHAVGGAGGRVGPDLATIGTAMPVGLVIESVLWPNKQVKEGYTATLIETKAGEVQQGYVISDEQASLTLRDPTTDQTFHFPKEQIKRRKEIGSLMPDGVTDGLTRAELRDLIRFLTELGKPGPYRIAAGPVVRVWETPENIPEALRRIAPEQAMLPDSIDPGPWHGRYAMAGGELPLAEIMSAEGGAIAVARFAAEVVTAGGFRLKTNAPAGSMVWLDRRPLPLRDVQDVNLASGLHTFTFRIDAGKIGVSGLSCVLEPASAGAEARLATRIGR